MEQKFQNLKCNVTITLPINVISKLDQLSNKERSRNKIVNDAILNWLQNRYQVKF